MDSEKSTKEEVELALLTLTQKLDSLKEKVERLSESFACPEVEARHPVTTNTKDKK